MTWPLCEVELAKVKTLLEQLRTKVESAQGMPATTKSDLLQLIADLEQQATGTTAEHAAQSRHHAARLTEYVEELEVSHPDITNLANRIATMLANLGI